MNLHAYLLANVSVWIWGSLMVFIFILTQLAINYIVERFYDQQYLVQFNEITVNIFQAVATIAAILFGFLAFFVLNNLQTAIQETDTEVAQIGKVFRELILVPDQKAVQPAQQMLFAYLLDIIDVELPIQKQGILHQGNFQLHGWNQLERFAQLVLNSDIPSEYKKNIIDELQDLYTARRDRINNDDLILPANVWVVAFWAVLLMMINVAFIGCHDHFYRVLYSALFAASIGLVIMLIYELDLPFLGAISVNDTPHKNLVHNMVNRLGHDYLFEK